MLDGDITIVIGPNGGGKTNLLDSIVLILQRHLFAAPYFVKRSTVEREDRWSVEYNDVLNNLMVERNSASKIDDPQIIEVEIEVTAADFASMTAMRADAARLADLGTGKYVNLDLIRHADVKTDAVKVGDRLSFTLKNGTCEGNNEAAKEFMKFLSRFHLDRRLREEFDYTPLSSPMIYLPVNRAASSLQSTVNLAGHNENELMRQAEGASSRHPVPIVALAIGRLARKYRLLQEQETGKTKATFHEDPNLVALTKVLQELGYSWELVCTNALTNTYDVQLTKQGSSFRVSAASSGERELLTYLFAIYALNVRDALIIVDEPELHLHPNWQRIMLNVFIRLTKETGNQFLLATHSPTFISPTSIQYVSRIYSMEQESKIHRLDPDKLPEAKHLLNIVNSQNNERLFFADKVILVEGISDRIFFEALLRKRYATQSPGKVIEIISVGGKGFFEAYAKLLRACEVSFATVADLDYIEQIGSAEVSKLFVTDGYEIKEDVIANVKSLDGNALVQRLDEALTTGNYDDCRALWSYIKSRHMQLKADLNDAEAKVLDEEVLKLRQNGLFILREGALEDYLPAGHRSKDLRRLIAFISSDDFTDYLPEKGRQELDEILKAILGDPIAEDAAPLE